MLTRNIYSQKNGAITVEVAIGIALAVVVLFVAIGLFNENLSAMITNSKIGNMFNNTGKTTYSSFAANYAGSQINVQLIGEQGLAMLRRIANNKAITQIDKFMDGSDTSVTNINSIGYLAIAINSIVGSPNICVYMKKDSDKKCEQDGIGGVAYYVTLNGGSVSVNQTGGGINTKYGTFGSDFTSAASGLTISTTSTSTSPMSSRYSSTNISTTSIYKYIKDLSAAAEQSKTVYDYVLLMKAINAGTPTILPVATIQTQINNIFSVDILKSLQNAHNACTDGNDMSNGNKGCGSTLADYFNSDTSFVGNDELDRYKTYLTTFTSLINGSTNVPNLENTLNSLLNSQTFKDIIYTTLREDNVNSTTTCELFTNELINLTNPPYNLNLNIPPCIPSGG